MAWDNISTSDLKVRKRRTTAESINKADGVLIFIQGCTSLVFLLGCATVVLLARTAQCVSSNEGETLTGILEMPSDLNNHLPATSLRVALHALVAFTCAQNRVAVNPLVAPPPHVKEA